MRAAARSFVVVFLACIAGPSLYAQGYPVRPVRVVVPYPPGGTADLLARLVGQKLSETLGRSFIIDNRGGAGGNIAGEMVAKSAPDGYTLLLANAPVLAVNPSLYSKLPFDPIKDFAPVCMIANVPLLLIIHPSLPVHSVKELIAFAQARPGKVNYASAGGGSTTFLATELFKTMAKVDLVAIPYKGSGPALAALVSGEVPIMFELFPTAFGFVKSDKVRALAVTSPQRSSLMPQLPTVAETGLPGYEVASWFGLAAPAGTPQDIIARLNEDVGKMLSAPEMRERFASLGAEPHAMTPQQFARLIPAEITKWAKVVKESGAHVD